MANVGELPYEVLGTAPKFGLREEIEFAPVFVLKTTLQEEIWLRVRTGCNEKRAARTKFVVFQLLIGLVPFDIIIAFAVAFVVAPRIYRCA